MIYYSCQVRFTFPLKKHTTSLFESEFKLGHRLGLADKLLSLFYPVDSLSTPHPGASLFLQVPTTHCPHSCAPLSCCLWRYLESPLFCAFNEGHSCPAHRPEEAAGCTIVQTHLVSDWWIKPTWSPVSQECPGGCFTLPCSRARSSKSFFALESSGKRLGSSQRSLFRRKCWAGLLSRNRKPVSWEAESVQLPFSNYPDTLKSQRPSQLCFGTWGLWHKVNSVPADTQCLSKCTIRCRLV